MSNEQQLYYEVAGNGPPVLLIHCPAVTCRFWQPVVEQLSRNCRCLTVDLPGHGRSPCPPEGWTSGDVSRLLAKLCQEIGLTHPLLVGYSTGSVLALRTAMDYPHLPSGVVTVGGFAEGASMGIQVAGWGGLAMNTLGMTGLIARLVAVVNSHGWAHFREMVKDAHTISRVGLQSYLKVTVGESLTDRLPEIVAPVRLVIGPKDSKAKALQPALQAELRCSELVVLPQGTHHIPTQQPGELAKLISSFAHRHATDGVGSGHPLDVPDIPPPFDYEVQHRPPLS